MSILNPRCPHCQKEIRINDSVIKFSKYNIYHEKCYRVLQESNYQGAWLDKVELLQKVNKSLIKFRSRIESEKSSFDKPSIFQTYFYGIINRLNLIADTCKVLNFFQKNKIKKTLKRSTDKTDNLQTLFLKNMDDLDYLRKILANLLEDLIDVNNELKSYENRAKAKIREGIQKKIDGIPKRVTKY